MFHGRANRIFTKLNEMEYPVLSESVNRHYITFSTDSYRQQCKSHTCAGESGEVYLHQRYIAKILSAPNTWTCKARKISSKDKNKVQFG